MSIRNEAREVILKIKRKSSKPYVVADYKSFEATETFALDKVSREAEAREAEDIEINSKIPDAASALNKLADHDWVVELVNSESAYYITSNAAGDPFATREALENADEYWSGGEPRTPTRNDYAVVQDYEGTQWRFIYAVPRVTAEVSDTESDSESSESPIGHWEPQYPIETNDYDGLSNKPSVNGVELIGNKTADDLGLRNYDDLTYNQTVQEAAWTVVLSSGATVLDTADLFGTETVPTPSGLVKQIKWRGTGTSGSAITVEQNASSLTTAWLFYYDAAPANVLTTTTNNSTDPNPTSLTWSDTPTGTSLTATKGQKPHIVEDWLAKRSEIPEVVSPSTTAQTGQAADAKDTGDALLLNPIEPSDWTVAPEYSEGVTISYEGNVIGWMFGFQKPSPQPTDWVSANDTNPNASSLRCEYGGTTYAATRGVDGYRLGPDSVDNPNYDKILATEIETENLRSGKADKVSGATDGDIAALDASGNLKLSGMNRDANGNLNATEFDFTSTQVVDYDSLEVGTVVNKSATPVVLHAGEYWLVRKSFIKTSSWNNDMATGRILKPGATGVGSMAWGEATSASGNGADSEGKNTKAAGAGAHAEGQDTDATATCAHAEGLATTASGTCSHAEGNGTKAQNQSEHAQGEFNVSHVGSTNSEKTLHSIGIGTADNARENAVEVMRDGKVFVNGVGGYDGTNPTGSGVKDLAAAIPEAATNPPPMAEGDTGAVGDSDKFARENHVHPAETEVSTIYSLPASALPVIFYGQEVTADGIWFEEGEAASPYDPSLGRGVYMHVQGESDYGLTSAAFFSLQGVFLAGDGSLNFNGTAGVSGESPVLKVSNSVAVRDVPVATTADLDGKVSKSGDTMTGALTVTGSTSVVSGNGKTTTQFLPASIFRKITGTTSYTLNYPPTGGTLALKSSVDAVADDVSALQTSVAGIEALIPSEASSDNQLADKDFVNSSIATNTANFRGTSDAPTQAAFEAWLETLYAENNDYVFWQTTDAAGNTVYKRYKYSADVEHSGPLPAEDFPITWDTGRVDLADADTLIWEPLQTGNTALKTADGLVICSFDAEGRCHIRPDQVIVNLAFAGRPAEDGVWPVLDEDSSDSSDEPLAGHWLFEYELNNSSFTATQWAAINSGIVGVVDPSPTATQGQAASASGVVEAITLTEREYSDWSILHTPLTANQKAEFYAEDPTSAENDYAVTIRGNQLYVGEYYAASVTISEDGLSAAYDMGGSAASIWSPRGTTVATRTALQGYILGPDSQDNPNKNKPIASEAEAEALRAEVANKKPIQTPVSNPPVGSSTTNTFIDSITQDANGVITATRKQMSLSATDNWSPSQGNGSTTQVLNQRGILRFRQTLIGKDWAPNYEYKRGMVVLPRAASPVGLYICLEDHTSEAEWKTAEAQYWQAVDIADVLFSLQKEIADKDSIKSPDGDTVVSANNDGTAKVAHTDYVPGGNATVMFPEGYSIDYYGQSYAAPLGGESIEFFGPIPGAYGENYWVPAAYKDLTYFDPSEQSVWCLFGSPSSLMYGTGPIYAISDWDSVSPTLTLQMGEETGDPPTMTRGTVPSTETKTVATTDEIPAVVSPSTSATTGQAADAKATGDALVAVTPDWVQTSAYAAYDCVKYNGAYYYAKTDIVANTAWNANNWGSLANLAALAHLFLPLTGGTVTGDLTVTYSSDGFKVQDGNGNYVKFVHGMVAGDYWYIEYYVNGVGNGSVRLPYGDIIPASEDAIAQEFNEYTTYAVGDVVMYNGFRYRCTTAVTTEGAWTGFANWTVETVQEAIEAGGGDKPTRIYNATGKDALDDKGQLFMPGTTGNYFVLNNTRYDYIGYLYYGGFFNNYFYTYANGGNALAFRSNLGNLRYGTVSDGEITSIGSSIYEDSNLEGRNPLNGDDINPTTPVAGLTFYPIATEDASTVYSHLAVETVPTRTIAANTGYALGDLLGDGGKAYRCKSAYTSASPNPIAPSSDTTHWDEVPVLAQKADKPATYADGHLASLTATGDLEDSGKSAADFMAADAKVRKLWAEADGSTVDAVGALRMTSLQESKWVESGGSGREVVYYGSTSTRFDWWLSTDHSQRLHYYSTTGEIKKDNYYSAMSHETLVTTVDAGLNPLSEICSFPNITFSFATGAEGTFVFTPRQLGETDVYAHFALESVPDRTWAAGVWAVGDLVKYSDKAYRCESATTASDTTAPSSDTTHWEEVPVLRQKEDSSNKVTSISAQSTDTQYPSAKCVYDAIQAGGGGGGTPLAGESYDFGFNSEIVRAVADVVRALGGTVYNDPTDQSSSS